MKPRLMRTVIATSLLTALLGTALAMYVPRLSDNLTASNGPVTLQPTQTAVAQNAAPAQPVRRARRTYGNNAYSDSNYSNQAYANDVQRDAYGEPVRRSRSTRDSVLIVAGSAGAGAAIGALAGGGKGAAIGALAGGVGGLVYDRITAHK
ncbi:MAG TPA: hypothetical protein VFA60_02185 [Terriglobales bacterium]|nr:hypothetical protein [Terriglobales bacterium]